MLMAKLMCTFEYYVKPLIIPASVSNTWPRSARRAALLGNMGTTLKIMWQADIQFEVWVCEVCHRMLVQMRER